MVIKKFNRSELTQKFMQVVIDVTCMHINFGEHGFCCFRDIATFKNSEISHGDHMIESSQKCNTIIMF